jgi:hypothetical protein
MKTISIVAGLALALALYGFTSTTNNDPATPDEDKYKVIKVNGAISYKQSGKSLSQGDVFSPTQKLIFKTTESRAAVISRSKGRFILSAKANTSSSSLLPAMNNISSRAGALLNKIDLENHFKGNYLVLDRVELEISEKSFPMDANNFFYMQYTYNGETINKKLNNDGNKLIIDKSQLLKVDDKAIERADSPQMKLWYMKGAEKKSVKINEFTPVFPNLSELKVEMEIILSELDGKSEQEKIDESTAYLNEFYGKPQKESLETWLKGNFKL